MKNFLIILLALFTTAAFAANPSFSDFNVNQFGTTGNKVVVKSGAILTNPIVRDILYIGGTVDSLSESGTSLDLYSAKNIWLSTIADPTNKILLEAIGGVYATSGGFVGNGAGLTNIGGGTNSFVGTFTGNGAGLTNLSRVIPASPVPVLFDDDFESDIGDYHGLAFSLLLDKIGKIRLLGVGCSMSNTATGPQGMYAASAVRAVTSFYGRNDMLIGTNARSASVGNGTGACPYIATNFWGTNLSWTEMDVIALYRKALADSPSNSVALVVNGTFNNVADLWRSGPDGYSSLAGSNLMNAKLRGIFAGAGDYPNGSEYNLAYSPAFRTAAQVINEMTNSTFTIIWSGYSVGVSGNAGSGLDWQTVSNSPITLAHSFAGVHYRPFWEELPLMAAVGTTMLTNSATGWNTVNAAGSNTFIFSGAGNQRFLGLTTQATNFGNYLDWLYSQAGRTAGLGYLGDGTISISNSMVGIGNGYPRAKMDLGTDTAAEKLLIFSGPTYHYGMGMAAGEMRTFVAAAAKHKWGVEAATTFAYTDLMTLDSSNGRLGVGVTSPAAMVDVLGDIRASTTITATNGVIARTVNTTTPGFKSTGTNNVVLTASDGGTWILRVDAAGALSTVTNTAGL